VAVVLVLEANLMKDLLQADLVVVPVAGELVLLLVQLEQLTKVAQVEQAKEPLITVLAVAVAHQLSALMEQPALLVMVVVVLLLLSMVQLLQELAVAVEVVPVAELLQD
jgi:hypothetical protein